MNSPETIHLALYGYIRDIKNIYVPKTIKEYIYKIFFGIEDKKDMFTVLSGHDNRNIVRDKCDIHDRNIHIFESYYENYFRFPLKYKISKYVESFRWKFLISFDALLEATIKLGVRDINNNNDIYINICKSRSVFYTMDFYDNYRFYGQKSVSNNDTKLRICATLNMKGNTKKSPNFNIIVDNYSNGGKILYNTICNKIHIHHLYDFFIEVHKYNTKTIEIAIL